MICEIYLYFIGVLIFGRGAVFKEHFPFFLLHRVWTVGKKKTKKNQVHRLLFLFNAPFKIISPSAVSCALFVARQPVIKEKVRLLLL